jgi:hypothetical protein
MMKSLALAGVLAVVLVAPAMSRAEVVDGKECSMTFVTGRLIQLNPGAGVDSDRFAICVSDGVSANGAELYVGGELDPEQATSGEGFCGAVILAGRTLRGTPDWDRVEEGADPANTADDVHLSCD